MSEMLANQYFLARRFDKAQPLLAALLAKEPDNFRAKKKLVICCTQLGEPEQAERLFVEVMHANPRVIIDTDPQSEDCPCPELVERLEREIKTSSPSIMQLNRLGMLYSYCNAATALAYFRRSLRMNRAQPRIQAIVDILTQLQEVKA